MSKSGVLVLDEAQIRHKIKRIAYQIYESNVSQNRIILAGIAQNGYEFAKKLQVELQNISDLEVRLCEVTINKKDPLEPIETSLSANEYKDQSLVLCDDVLNSGTTLIYGVRHFLAVPLTQFKTAVLVDRSHKKYPVKADFKGISFSTSLNERIEVIFGPEEDKVVLI